MLLGFPAEAELFFLPNLLRSVLIERTKMKKRISASGLVKIASLILLAALLALALCGCGAKSDGAGTVTVVVASDDGVTEYPVDLSELALDEGALSVLKYLKAEGKLDYEASEGIYGAFLTRVGDIVANDAECTYVALYTSVAKDIDVSAYATTVEYGGVTLTSSGVGISSMSVKDGAVLYFCKGSY